jgi:hypothetical protein
MHQQQIRERRPALREEQETRRSSPDYLFSLAHLDNAYRIEAEMLVAFARQMLCRHPGDPLDTPIVHERRQEAARAALDVLWAVMAEHSAAHDLPPPTPALLALRLQPQRRLRRLPRPG